MIRISSNEGTLIDLPRRQEHFTPPQIHLYINAHTSLYLRVSLRTRHRMRISCIRISLCIQLLGTRYTVRLSLRLRMGIIKFHSHLTTLKWLRLCRKLAHLTVLELFHPRRSRKMRQSTFNLLEHLYHQYASRLLLSPVIDLNLPFNQWPPFQVRR